MSKKEFEKNLQKSGYGKTNTSKDGKSTKFEKDGKSYTTRPDKGGGNSADFRKNDESGKVDLKIRLGGEQFKADF